LGIGDWGLGNPQSPIPNPQFFIFCFLFFCFLLKIIFFYLIILFGYFIIFFKVKYNKINKMNNGNKKNFPYDSNSQSSNLNENAIPDNTINYQVKDNIDMKNFIEENNNKDTIRQISASNDFCIICEVKK